MGLIAALTACSGQPTQEQVAAVANSNIPPGAKPISEVEGQTQSISEFCKKAPKPKVPNGDLSLKAVCAPAFLAKHGQATVKTVAQSGIEVLMFGAPTKVDEVCQASSFKAPVCRGFRPGDTMPAMPLTY